MYLDLTKIKIFVLELENISKLNVKYMSKYFDYFLKDEFN